MDNRGDRGDREFFDAVCSDCGQPCKVPFKPTEGRPIYCRDCFKKHRKF
ncbi:MAG: CxxC-x17-CxxC domain-containing protein [Candidatus Micrarchaeia archaeon]